MANFDNIQKLSISSVTVETVIGSDTKFKGDIKTDRFVRIDGDFEGTIESTDLVYISETGKFKGNLVCNELQVIGYGEGTARCTDTFQIAASGVFVGEVEAANLLTDKGCKINGNCKIIPA